MNKARQETLYCSFCCKSQFEVRQLIAGPAVFICDECVELCAWVIKQKRFTNQPWLDAEYGPRLSNTEAAA